ARFLSITRSGTRSSRSRKCRRCRRSSRGGGAGKRPARGARHRLERSPRHPRPGGAADWAHSAPHPPSPRMGTPRARPRVFPQVFTRRLRRRHQRGALLAHTLILAVLGGLTPRVAARCITLAMPLQIIHSMFHPGLPLLEKILRPLFVYVFLIIGLRLA